MTEDTHTPGPWKWLYEDGLRSAYDDRLILEEKWEKHCYGEGCLDTYIDASEKDKSLIKAAPDLLRALKDLVEVAKGNIYPESDKPNSDWGILQRAIEVIEKAEGRSDD